MKSLKFSRNQIQLILSGQKTVTWRLFDEKDLQSGDAIALINTETKEVFATGVIVAIREKKLGEITEPDFLGHEHFRDPGEMLKQYRQYYGPQVTMETPIKMVEFTLTSTQPR
ncbi:MAG: ASCH domain-containing protein [Candidatus Kerfeldbacteria bacterium]|nr:ASCH domain-containing protein [Candidatus Kerfeldbacteria bacterium]